MGANTEVFDWWLQRTAVYGLAFLFTAGVLLIILWVAVVIIGLAKKWVPAWFESQIVTNDRVATAVERMVSRLERMEIEGGAMRRGLMHLFMALETYVQGNRDKLGVGDNVDLHMNNAKREFESAERYRWSQTVQETNST